MLLSLLSLLGPGANLRGHHWRRARRMLSRLICSSRDTQDPGMVVLMDGRGKLQICYLGTGLSSHE